MRLYIKEAFKKEKIMKSAIIIILTAWSFFSCTMNHTTVVETPEEKADPVVTEHGLLEDFIGYEEVKVDTTFPWPGSIEALEAMDLDYVSCTRGRCYGTYTRTLELVDYTYEITVANMGTAPAYGLIATIHTVLEEPDEYDPYSTIDVYLTQELYMADVLDPGWEATVSYALDYNEEVLEFMGIEWDDWDIYSRKLQENPNHYTALAKKGSSKKITVKKREIK
jgi:hypothetical protein